MNVVLCFYAQLIQCYGVLKCGLITVIVRDFNCSKNV